MDLSGISLPRTPETFIGAVRAGLVDRCREMLAGGRSFLDGHWYAKAALNDAAQYGYIELCEILLDAGFSPNVFGRPGFAPLHMAQSYGHVDIVKQLLAAGASPSYVPEPCPSGWLTPFQSAVASGREEAVTLYVELCSEDLAQRTLGGRTLGQLASLNPSMVALLHSLKTDLEVRDALDALHGPPQPVAVLRTCANSPL